MRDKSSKNRQKSQKNSNSNAGPTNPKVNQTNKNVNEPATVKSAKQQQQQQESNSIITTASASTIPDTKNATNCDSGECFGSSQNGNVVAPIETIKDCSTTAPSSDETDRSTTVDSNCNTIRIDSKPNRDKPDVDSTNNIVTTAPPSQVEPVNNGNISTSTQNCNAQSNEMPTAKFQSNFRNQIMEQMKNASVDVPDSSLPPPTLPPLSLQKQTSLTYTDGQWSPSNSDGKKFYNRDQLILLRNQPASQFEPNLAGRLSAIVKPINSQSNGSQGGGNDLLPKFAGQSNFKQSGSHQRHNYSKRPSQNSMQQNAQNNGNANKGSKSGIIHMSLSIHEDVKLNETENAWVPAFRRTDNKTKTDAAESDALSSNEMLFKSVRGVLNKLTPERFNTLFEEINNFNIGTTERLNGVISLVFEKAIDEPHFSVAYAQLCGKLSESLAALDADAGDKKAFKKTLITKCQNEFEKHVVNEKTIADKLAPFLAKINETDDPDKKLEYQIVLSEEEGKLRRRSVGTVRFIGELYKIGMLTSKIMIGCIKTLIDRDSEDKLECSCKLLTTIGAKLEESVQAMPELKIELNESFKQMQMIVDRKIPNLKISSRVKFMLQDVLDLRKRRWVPRHTDVNPKTMGQIQKEADAEQEKIILLNYNVRRDDRGRNDNRTNGGYQKSNRQSTVEDGWLPSSKSRSSTFFDASKFKNNKSSIDDNTIFGSASLFKWGQNAGNNPTSTSAAPPGPPIANSFAALDSARGLNSSIENQSRNSNNNNRNGRDNYHSKGSMERYQHSNRRDSRSGSQHRSRENSLARNFTQRNAPPFNRSSQSMNALPTPQPQQQPSIPIGKADGTVNPNPVEPTSAEVEKVQKLVREMLENHHIGEVSLANCHVDVDKIRMEHRWVMVRELFNTAVEVQRLKTSDRIFAGKSLNQWLKMKLITRSDILTGTKSFLEPVDDISLDIPHIWLYVAEMIAPIIENDNLKLVQLKTLCPDHVHRILEDLLPYLGSTYGPNFVRTLLKLNRLDNLVPKTELISTKLKNYIATITDSATEAVVASEPESGPEKPSNDHVNMEDVQRHIKNLLLENVKLDDIYNYISANVTEIDNNFMRALTSAVVDSSLDNRFKLNEKHFLQRIPLLERYVDGSEQLQVQCLIAIQLLIHRLEHPQGLMQSIFSSLVTEKIISADSIMNWKNQTDVMEGKGVAVSSLRSFFEALENMSDVSDDEDN